MNDNDVFIKAPALFEKFVRFRERLIGGLASHIQPQVISALPATLPRYSTPTSGVWAPPSSTRCIAKRKPA